ncbi:MAG: hypothetical protein LBJ15_19630 [Comamonas sp.]|jgi:hypothetical protein|uniref:hypothetical protein n=1 Tax=Comamonas sp. TaxID=34028 RepID=UPI00282B6016|nr:hypothetical protein [Comamonas sp.]MDR0216187.1 hypothetical protein [Comamonas sp.]
MAIDYDEIAAGALESIAEAGQPVTLHRKGPPGPFVPGQPVTPTVVDYPGTGAVFGYKQRDIDGTLIKHGDQRMLLAPQIEVAPKTGDTMTAGASVYNVVDVGIVAPAGVAVLYKLQLRGV